MLKVNGEWVPAENNTGEHKNNIAKKTCFWGKAVLKESFLKHIAIDKGIKKTGIKEK